MGKFKHKLGIEAEDRITGFKGIVIGAARYLTGCDQYALKPLVDDKGNMRDSKWFDEGEINKIGEGVHKKEVKSETKGGPQPDTPSI